jgi:hypothetical protein
MTYPIASTVARMRRQMGDYLFIRYCRNIGMTFEETYFEMFGKMPPFNQG